jgi:hypothetical protein
VRALVVLCLLAGVSNAKPGIHGSAGIGGTLISTGARGDRFRFEATFDLKVRSRYGFGVGWRAFDDTHRGLVTAGLVYEGAAARPRLVLDLHADVGVDLDERAPLVGAGLRTTVGILGPLAVVLDGGGYLVIDGFENTRLQLQGSLILSARW